MTTPTVALKVDVDTHAGTRDGVPRLLDILGSRGIRATFYFSLGPDNSGKAVRRVFTRKGFLGKMLRTKAPAVYGLRTMLYGTLLPAPLIARDFPGVLRATVGRGHEAGIHCWDHVEWHDRLPRWAPARVRSELALAAEAFRGAVGFAARTTAAPGWTVSPASLDAQEGMGLDFCSDARGRTPFHPVMNGRRYATLQVPTTLPTMDELLGADGITAENINDRYLSLLGPGLNVHTIHAELEGGAALAPVFGALLERLSAAGARFVTLGEAAREARLAGAPDCPLAMGEIHGRAGLVALQGDIVA
jgi:peptidoglycan/xylan/chitin deacetylase (PgdA/CDA1 family)